MASGLRRRCWWDVRLAGRQQACGCGLSRVRGAGFAVRETLACASVRPARRLPRPLSEDVYLLLGRTSHTALDAVCDPAQ